MQMDALLSIQRPFDLLGNKSCDQLEHFFRANTFLFLNVGSSILGFCSRSSSRNENSAGVIVNHFER